MFIAHGRNAVSLAEFCYATRLAAVSVRRHMSDMDHIFGQVLGRHLDTIITAIAAIGRNTPDLFAARRAAYFAATRGFCNVPTPLHYLLTRERVLLPADELEPVERQRSIIAAMLGADTAPEDTLNLLDSPTLDLEQIEAMHAAMLDVGRRRAARYAHLLQAAPPDPPEPAPIAAMPEPPQPTPPQTAATAVTAATATAHNPLFQRQPWHPAGHTLTDFTQTLAAATPDPLASLPDQALEPGQPSRPQAPLPVRSRLP